MKKAALILGSDSDFEKARGALDVFREYGVSVETRVLSAHRTPGEAAAFAESAKENGFGVILAAAGMAAHLAGALAGRTTLPVIGIPMGFGLVGMWVGFALDENIRGIILVRRWRSCKWKTKGFVKSSDF